MRITVHLNFLAANASVVAIARALVNNPAPGTGGLNLPVTLTRRNADSIFQLLGELNRLQGTAFLVVTHDLQLAKRHEPPTGNA